MTNELLDPIKIATIVAAKECESVDSSLELLCVFGEDGEGLGLAPRILCHRLGLIHKSVFCFIGNSEGHLLLQTRKGGRLDVAVGGHLCGDDSSAEDAIIREISEEIGLEVNADRLRIISSYRKNGGDRLSKPREINNELRILYYIELSDSECQALAGKFNGRRDKDAILSIEWFDAHDVLAACDAGRAADGLSASIPHYLLWSRIQPGVRG